MKSKNLKKRTKVLLIIDFYMNYHFFLKKLKIFTNYQVSIKFPFFPKKSKSSKRLTNHHKLRNIVLLYNSVGISKRERAFRGYAENYNVEVTDTKSLAD